MSFGLSDMADKIAKEESEQRIKVFRLRDKRTGKFLGGGHGTYSGIYPTLKGLKSAIKTSWEYPKYSSKVLDNAEVVTFELVETGSKDLQEILQESSKG